MAELQEIRKDIASSSLTEAFDEEFFARIERQIHRFESGESNEIHSVYSLLQPPEQRKKLIEFAELVRPKMDSREWGDLCEKLASWERLRGLNAAFEVTIAGNILAQLPSEKVDLHARTNGAKNVDVCINLIDRPIYVEATVLGESLENIRWRETKGSRSYVRMGSPSMISGKRVLRAVANKGRDQFMPGTPTVLVISVFDVWDKLQPARKALSSAVFENIGLLLPFGRKELMAQHISRPDPACSLTLEEEQAILELLNGRDFFPIGYG